MARRCSRRRRSRRSRTRSGATPTSPSRGASSASPPSSSASAASGATTACTSWRGSCARRTEGTMSSFRPDAEILKKHPDAVTQQQLEERSRFLGCLLGAAAGEALGAPHENRTAAELTPAPREITGGGIWAAGEPTDDIQL